MERKCKAPHIRFGFSKTPITGTRRPINAGGSNFVLVTPDGRAEVKMGLIGRHNIENALPPPTGRRNVRRSRAPDPAD